MKRRANPKEPAPAYQWFAKDKLSDIDLMLLPLDAYGLFRLLYDHAWAENGLPMNLDKIFGLSRCRTRAEFRSLWKHVSPLFPRASDGRLRNRDQELQRRELEEFRQSRTAAANARWNPKKRSARASKEATRAPRPHTRALQVQSSASAPALELLEQTQDQKHAAPAAAAFAEVAGPRQNPYDGDHRPTMATVEALAHGILEQQPLTMGIWNDVLEKLKTRCGEIKLDYGGIPQAALQSIWDKQRRRERAGENRPRSQAD